MSPAVLHAKLTLRSMFEERRPGSIVLEPIGAAVSEGELWGRAAAELALEGELDPSDEAPAEGVAATVEILLATTVARIEQEKGERFAGLFEASARSTLAHALAPARCGSRFWLQH